MERSWTEVLFWGALGGVLVQIAWGVLKGALNARARRRALAAVRTQVMEGGTFVLDVERDAHAIPAMLAYAASCEQDDPALAEALRAHSAVARWQARRR